MMRRVRPRLTYANVISTLALFLILAGGGAYAAKKHSKGAVKTKDIKNLAVTNPKIGNLAVTEPKIGNLAVTNPKIGDKQVKTGKLGELSVTNAKLADGAVSAGKTSFAVASGRIASNPAAGATLTPALLNGAGVTLSGSCAADGADSVHTATVHLTGPANTFYSGVEAGDGIAPHDVTSSLPGDVGTALSGSTGLRKDIQLQVVTPTGALTLNIAVAVNEQGTDCVFSASGFAS
jgi:hypothetical protein